MIYKEFIAEAAEKIMAERINGIEYETIPDDLLGRLARGSVQAAKALADALEEDFAQEPADGGIRRYAETETFFDNYVNWTKTK